MPKSKSKARRERAVAVRSQLWRAAQSSEHGAVKSSDVNVLASLLHRLAGLETLVGDMHWVTVGQWQQYGTTAANHDATDVHRETGQVGSALCPSGFGSGVQLAPAQFLGKPADACETKHKMETTKFENTVEKVAEAPAIAEKAPMDVQSGVWEPLDPWLLLDKEELRCVRESCKDNRKAVDKFTPFSCFRQDCEPSVREESEPDSCHDEQDDFDRDEMEELYQLAVREHPENQEQKFQQLFEERRQGARSK
jgi:hypothetical protein